MFSHQQSSNSSASQVLKPYKKIALKQSGHNRTDSSLAGQDDDIYDDKMTPDDVNINLIPGFRSRIVKVGLNHGP